MPALIGLLTEDAVKEMPPVPLWYRGRRDYGLFIRRVFALRGTGWIMRPLTARRPAAGPSGTARMNAVPKLIATRTLTDAVLARYGRAGR